MIHREQCMAKSVFKCKFHINPRFKFMPKGRRPEGLHWSKGWYGMWYRFWHTLLFLFYIWIKKASFHFHVKFGLRSKTRPLSRFLSRQLPCILYLMAIGDICNDNFARLLNQKKSWRMSRLKIKMSIDTNLVIVIVKENYLTMKRNISNLIMCQHLYDYVNNRKKFQKERV